MKVMITGGSGFIGGSILSSYLSVKNILVAPTHAELDLLDTDAVHRYVRDVSPDVIIHCATQNRTENVTYMDTLMYNNLAQSECGKMLNFSSGAIYDMSKKLYNMSEYEIGASIPKDEYGYSKYIEHLIGKQYPHVTDLILFGVFGIGELASRFIPTITKKQFVGGYTTIIPDREMDFLYIEDLMPILDKFICNEPKYSAYNITPSDSISLLELSQYILDDTTAGTIVVGAKQNTYTGNNDLLLSEFPDIVFTPIEEAVQEYVTVLKEKYNVKL